MERVRGQVSVTIGAPPEVVWRMIADVRRMGEWSPETYRCEWIAPATAPVVGARFRGYNRRGLLRWPTASYVRRALQASLDVGTTAVTAYAVRLADKPPDREHPFGHGRAENLAALGQATVLVVLGGLLAASAVRRLAGEPRPAPARMVVGIVAVSLL